MIEAMVYVLRTGVPWRDVPACFGPWNSVYTRWRRWCPCGLWAKLLAVLARRASGVLRFLDASHSQVHPDASNPAGGQQHQAIGRTKGGLNTKLTAWVDTAGRAVTLHLAPGQRADGRAALRRRGGQSCLSPRARRHHPASWHRGHYRQRRKVENFFQRAKRHRRIGTRYEKRDLYFLSFVHLFAILDWLK